MAADNLMSFCTFEIIYPFLGNENGYPVLDQVPHTRIGVLVKSPSHAGLETKKKKKN